MGPVRILACFLVLSIAPAVAPDATVAAAAPAPTVSADELVGLWKAKRRFGPDARGPLIVQKTPSGWLADFVGRKIPVRENNSVLTFELPNGEGSFRARMNRDGGISGGQWFQPSTQANGPFATGLAFKPDGRNRWRGNVLPVDDTFTLYLMLQKHPDGSTGAFIRNPERNIGLSYDADHLVREGDAVRLIGRRSGTKTDSVLMSGRIDRQNGIFTLYFSERGGTYDFKREGGDSDFYPRGKNPGRYVYAPPLAREDLWPTATLEEAQIDRKGIENFIQRILDTPIDSVSAPQVDGILIARHGKLVLEEYFHGYDRDTPHDTRSAGKSLTATLIGAAIQSGAPLRLSSPVYQVMNGGVFPEQLEPRKREMTLENLMTMSSGFFCDDGDPEAPGNEETMQNQTEEPDYYRYTLRVPMNRRPGEKAVYCSANPNLVLGVLNFATGEHVMDLFDRLLGGPLRIARHAWFVSPALQPYGGGGVRMVPRDFMKLGQLMLNGGTWNGRRILSRGFVDRASAPLYDLNNIKYGYFWWGLDWPYKNRKVHAYFAAGNGGQSVIVVPALDLVIATYAGSYASRVGLEIQQGYTPRYILPAVRERGDRMEAPVVPQEYELVYGRPSPAK